MDSQIPNYQALLDIVENKLALWELDGWCEDTKKLILVSFEKSAHKKTLEGFIDFLEGPDGLSLYDLDGYDRDLLGI